MSVLFEPSDDVLYPGTRRTNSPRIVRLKRKAAQLPVLRQVARVRRHLRTRRARAAEVTPPICESVLAWAVEHPDTRYWRLAPPERVAKQPPNTIEPQAHRTFIEFPEVPVVELEGARLEVPESGKRGNYVCPRLVLPDGYVSSESTSRRVTRCLSNPPDLAVPMEGDYFSLMSRYASDGNYYHWLHDVLLSLYGVSPHLPPGTRFIVEPDLRPFHLESLAMVGIAPEQLISFDPPSEERPTRAWRLERLWYSPGPIGASASPAALAWLGAAGLALLDSAPRPAHRFLYISRRQALYRRAVNEDEVITYLADRGFEFHTLEDYTLREQIALFAEAKVVMGPHGAGHTNMIFSPRGLVVVDILNSDVNKCFHNMCLTLGHEYWYMFGDDVPGASKYTSDIFVPLDKLARITSLALASAGRASGFE